MKEPQKCRIRIKGLMNHSWSGWFENFNICHRNGETILSGTVPDQSALHGLLNKIRDLGIELISVELHDSDGGNHRRIDPRGAASCE